MQTLTHLRGRPAAYESDVTQIMMGTSIPVGLFGNSKPDPPAGSRTSLLVTIYSLPSQETDTNSSLWR